MSKMVDLIGKRFGRLVVVEQVGKDKRGNIQWLCQCDCGKRKIIRGNDLRSGNTKSCGCLNTKHGHKKRNEVTKLYRIWGQMIQRCTNQNNKAYHNYGGRGITVCERWMKFENFLEDMGESWEPGLTLGRSDNNKGYYPDNCEWITQKEQMRNTRHNHVIEYNGKIQCIAAWSEKTGIPYQTLWRRIYIYKWLIKKALTTSVRKRKRKRNESKET